MSAPVSEPTRILGERIRTRRKALGISQEVLASRCGLHWSYVGSVERGQHNITLHNLLKLAGGLDVDAGELVRGLAAPSERKH
jgi:transcriptional regulator with XRE-family HTH domain